MRHIKREDTVMVMTGKDKGKTGKVIRVYEATQRILIQGINFVTRHVRRTREDQPWGRLQKERSVHISNVMLYCPKCSKPSKTRIKAEKDRKKVRVCNNCKEEV